MARYFKCGDSSRQCEIARSRKIIHESKWTCPAGKEQCGNIREPVMWVEAMWVLHRKKILIAGGATLILFLIGIITLLTRTSPLQRQYEAIRLGLDVLEARLVKLESQPTSSAAPSPEVPLKQMEQKAADIHARILTKLALKTEDGLKEAKDALPTFELLLKQGQATAQTANKPAVGSGPVLIEVRKLIPDLQNLQPRAEGLRNEAQAASNDTISNQADEILELIEKDIKRASKMLPKASTPIPLDLLTKFEATINTLRVGATNEIEGFKLPSPTVLVPPAPIPPPPPPVQPPDPRIPVILAKILKRDVKGAIQIPADFRFELGKDELNFNAKADIERLRVSIPKDFPKADVVVIGFTDNIGSEAIDTKLSLQRAVRITDELNKSNLSAKPAGFGRQTPVGDNTTEEGRARNRRAEVWVVPE